jgi:two-component system phosphate regulon sensor histidine kinase PhoR
MKLKGNKVLMEQALINLIDNACKYTNEDGRIWVKAEKITDSIHLIVKDTGIGIDQKDQIKVFERFYRVDKERSRIYIIMEFCEQGDMAALIKRCKKQK